MFVRAIYSQSVRQCSSLYITGDKATKTFAVLTPYIDFEQQLSSKNELLNNIKARNLPIDFNKVEEKWLFFKELDNQRNSMENNRIQIGEQIKSLLKNPVENNASIEKLKLHSKLIKEDLKSLKDRYFEVEENVMLQILDLPNVLHPKTRDAEILIKTCAELQSVPTIDSHMQIGAKLIEYKNPFACYLKSDAALFELKILKYIKSALLGLNYNLFSNSDFVRSVVVEGCGSSPHDGKSIFTLAKSPGEKSEPNLHLVGGSSLYSFMAYFTKHSIQSSRFPLRYFALGRTYTPPVAENSPPSLFNLNQQTTANIFIATREEDDLLEEIMQNAVSIYEKLGFHFRFVILPAKDLRNNESLRFSIQMYSNYLRKYVEVGNVSCYDSYLSKRLLFNYSNVDKERKYPKVIAGSLLNVHKMLGCILENNFVVNRDLLNGILI